MNNVPRLPRFAVFVLLVALIPSYPILAQGSSQTFPETGKTVKGRFLEYWQQNGGLPQQGYPISEEMQEKSETDGKTYTAQYFERAVFEAHPDNQKPYDVLLSLLGTFRYAEKYKTPPQGDSLTLPLDEAPTSSCPSTPDDPSPTYRANMPVRSSVGKGHTVTGYVLSSAGCAPIAGAKVELWPEVGDQHPPEYRATVFTDEHGKYSYESPPPQHIHMRISAHGYTAIFSNRYHPAEGQARGTYDVSLAPAPTCSLSRETGRSMCGGFLGYWETHEGLAQQGYPISGEFQEKSELDGKTYTVQYFERAVFEAHPENQPPYDVLLSQLGTFRYRAKHAPAGASAGTVEATSSMSVARACHSATLLPNGKVLIAAGMPGEGHYERSSELFDPKTHAFSPTGSMAVGRACHIAMLLPNGKVLVAGGANGDDASAELYDPTGGTFASTGDMNAVRDGATATLLKSGKVLVTGGFDFSRRVGQASAELYDPASGKFALTGSMRAARSAHTATLLPDGKVLVVGGGIGRNVLSDAEVYDPATGRFSPTGTMPLPRHKHTATLLAGGHVLITGGADNRDWNGRYAGSLLYDPKSGTFAPAGDMTAARFKMRDASATLPDGKVLVAGGSTVVELYDPASGTFSRVEGALDAERFYQTATTLPDGRVLITGGYDPGITSTARAWIF
ncbi:MAG TPA: kelch repeat-containing protein, partial [Chloroflexia bacterium]